MSLHVVSVSFVSIPEKNEPASAEDLDRMTPDERAALVRARIVTDQDELPQEFRDRIFETARRMSSERSSHE